MARPTSKLRMGYFPLPEAEARHAHSVLIKKYGWQRRLLDLFWVLGGRKPRIAGEIRLDS